MTKQLPTKIMWIFLILLVLFPILTYVSRRYGREGADHRPNPYPSVSPTKTLRNVPPNEEESIKPHEKIKDKKIKEKPQSVLKLNNIEIKKGELNNKPPLKKNKSTNRPKTILKTLNKQNFIEKQSQENKIDSMENKIDSQENKIDSMENKIDSMENKIDSQENKIDSMENKIDSMENEIDSMEISQQDNISQDINLLFKTNCQENIPEMNLLQANNDQETKPEQIENNTEINLSQTNSSPLDNDLQNTSRQQTVDQDIIQPVDLEDDSIAQPEGSLSLDSDPQRKEEDELSGYYTCEDSDENEIDRTKQIKNGKSPDQNREVDISSDHEQRNNVVFNKPHLKDKNRTITRSQGPPTKGIRQSKFVKESINSRATIGLRSKRISRRKKRSLKEAIGKIERGLANYEADDSTDDKGPTPIKNKVDDDSSDVFLPKKEGAPTKWKDHLVLKIGDDKRKELEEIIDRACIHIWKFISSKENKLSYYYLFENKKKKKIIKKPTLSDILEENEIQEEGDDNIIDISKEPEVEEPVKAKEQEKTREPVEKIPREQRLKNIDEKMLLELKKKGEDGDFPDLYFILVKNISESTNEYFPLIEDLANLYNEVDSNDFFSVLFNEVFNKIKGSIISADRDIEYVLHNLFLSVDCLIPKDKNEEFLKIYEKFMMRYGFHNIGLRRIRRKVEETAFFNVLSSIRRWIEMGAPKKGIDPIILVRDAAGELSNASRASPGGITSDVSDFEKGLF